MIFKICFCKENPVLMWLVIAFDLPPCGGITYPSLGFRCEDLLKEILISSKSIVHLSNTWKAPTSAGLLLLLGSSRKGWWLNRGQGPPSFLLPNPYPLFAFHLPTITSPFICSKLVILSAQAIYALVVSTHKRSSKNFEKEQEPGRRSENDNCISPGYGCLTTALCNLW